MGIQNKINKASEKAADFKKSAIKATIIWGVLFIVIPVIFSLIFKPEIKKYMVVKSFQSLNSELTAQYKTVFNDIKNIDLTKNIKMDKIEKISIKDITGDIDKVKKTTKLFSRFGFKTNKIDNTTDKLKSKIDGINNKIENFQKDIAKKTQDTLSKTIDKELNKVASKTLRKQTGLSETSYKNLMDKNFGFQTSKKRKITSQIYTELQKSNTSTVRSLTNYTNKHFNYIFFFILTTYLLLIGITPIIAIVYMLKKVIGKTIKCPHCKKSFLSKAQILNNLKSLNLE